jgi:hypothetical protein
MDIAMLASERPLPTRELVARLIAAEARCMSDWLGEMRRLPGNPYDVAVETIGHATALVCGAIDAQVFNRVLGLTVDDRDRVALIIALYDRHGVSPVFDLDPYAIPPYWEQPNVFDALMAAGFRHGAFHQVLYAVPRAVPPPLPDGVTITEVGPVEADAFCDTYDRVWGESGAIRVLVGAPGFRCYLASVDGVPAGLGVLHVADGVGSMANALTVRDLRGRGCQSSLLHRRSADAHAEGCDLLASQCMPGTTSQDNQLRAGFHIAGSKAWWVRQA